MQVKYIGKKLRVNSFGTFEPGKEYDVSDEVGAGLLSVPLLFKAVEKKIEVQAPVKIEKPKFVKRESYKKTYKNKK